MIAHEHITRIGSGQVHRTGDGTTHLTIPHASADSYHDAQISTFITPEGFIFRDTPPLTLHVRAYATGDIHGTAGFGFWNQPFGPNRRFFRLPRAVWFFYGSPPNAMPWALDVPGHGWKCGTIDAANGRFLAMLPLAPPGFLLMRVPRLYRALWPVGQRAMKVSEHLLGERIPAEAHDYTLHWRADGVTFKVDGETVHESPVSPRGPLGFVAWVDNQYAIATPRGRFGFGLLAQPEPASLVLESLAIMPG
ncbi:MAG: hypothetical protein ACOCXZ_00410 [Chloroflexota bacterium]